MIIAVSVRFRYRSVEEAMSQSTTWSAPPSIDISLYYNIGGALD